MVRLPASAPSSARPTLPLFVHLALYFACSAAYAFTCGLLGRSYGPLAAYQMYTLACSVALVLALAGGRLTGLWEWRKLWPPSMAASKAALASVMILTASTLALLSPSSLLAIVAGKAGRLALVARVSPPSALVLPLLGMIAAVLAAWTKPPIAAVLPLALAGLYVAGYWVKLRAVTEAKQSVPEYDLELIEGANCSTSAVGHVMGVPCNHCGTLTHTSDGTLPRCADCAVLNTRTGLHLNLKTMSQKELAWRAIEQMKSSNVLIIPQANPERPEDFLAAEQFLVALGALGIASLMAHRVTPAALSDWRLWLLGATSLGAGLIGTRIMLRAEPSSVTFPAYSMASLLAALCASWARGELRWAWACWPSIAAAALACVVVWASSGGLVVVRRWVEWVKIALTVRQTVGG